MADRDENDLQSLFAAAREHGDIEGSEAEIGDLQGALRAAYELLNQEQRQEFFASRAVTFLIDREFEDEDVEDTDNNEGPQR